MCCLPNIRAYVTHVINWTKGGTSLLFLYIIKLYIYMCVCTYVYYINISPSVVAIYVYILFFFHQPCTHLITPPSGTKNPSLLTCSSSFINHLSDERRCWYPLDSFGSNMRLENEVRYIERNRNIYRASTENYSFIPSAKKQTIKERRWY